MGNALTSALFLAAIAYASFANRSWATTIGAVIGLAVATATAQLLDCDEPSIDSGLFGFNCILVGVALPTFIAVSSQLLLLVMVGAAVSTVLTAAFSATLTKAWGVPGSTRAFVCTGWLMVAGAYAFGSLHVNDASRLTTTYVQSGITISCAADLVHIFFRDIGQMVLLDSEISGVIIVTGIFIAAVAAGIATAAGSPVELIASIGKGQIRR